jgi:hypothetical protein
MWMTQQYDADTRQISKLEPNANMTLRNATALVLVAVSSRSLPSPTPAHGSDLGAHMGRASKNHFPNGPLFKALILAKVVRQNGKSRSIMRL